MVQRGGGEDASIEQRRILHAAAPRITQIVMNTTFRMLPDSAAAKGDKGAKTTLSPEANAMSQMMRGIHFPDYQDSSASPVRSVAV